MANLSSVCSEDSYTIYVGDTTDIVYVAPSVLDGGTIDANWSCSQQVINNKGQVVISEVAITTKSADNTEFKCYLTPAQTATLSPGTHTWIIQVVNSTLTPVITKESHFTLYVESQGIS